MAQPMAVPDQDGQEEGMSLNISGPQKLSSRGGMMNMLHREFRQRATEWSLNVSQIEKKLPDPEKAREFTAFAKALLHHLSPEEAQQFAVSPVEFVSREMVFRGLDLHKYRDLLQSGSFRPQAGEMGGEGVYFSNSPYSASTYQTNGAVAVVPRNRLIPCTEHGIMDVGSEMYQRENERYLASIPASERREAAYTIDNRWDVEGRSSLADERVHNIVMRRAQPVSVARVYLVQDGDDVREEVPLSPPSKRSA